LEDNGFTLEMTKRFDSLLRDSSWRDRTLLQLQKDMRMAGVRLDEHFEEDKEDPFSFIVGVIQELQGNKPLQDSLHYRIDLPKNILLDSLEDEDLARLYLLRSFQKVWLREQFSKSSAKDTPDSHENQLKA